MNQHGAVCRPFSLASSPDTIPLHPGQRLIVIGDIHGNYDLLVQRLRAGRVLDDDEKRWKRGENAIVVQVGDLLDRGSRELDCMKLLCRLSHEAVASGGAVIVLWGNHELMNVGGDFRCVQSNDPWKREFDAYCSEKWGLDWKRRYFTPSAVHNLPTFPSRWAACQPGGILSDCFFAQCKVAVQVGDTVCVHAHWDWCCFEEYSSISKANSRVRGWIRKLSCKPTSSGDERFLAIDKSMDATFPVPAPFWGTQQQTDHLSAVDVEHILSGFEDARRLVVGHQRVNHIQATSTGCLWKVDAEGQPEVLQVTHLDKPEDRVQVLDLRCSGLGGAAGEPYGGFDAGLDRTVQRGDGSPVFDGAWIAAAALALLVALLLVVVNGVPGLTYNSPWFVWPGIVRSVSVAIESGNYLFVAST